MFRSLLVANRGEIAARIVRTAKRMGLRTIAVHSAADAELPFVAGASEAVEIGPADPRRSYLDADAVLDAAHRTGAEAIHPGYGFLSENAGFAARVASAGLIWVGPAAPVMEQVADKIRARTLMRRSGVPVAVGSDDSCATVAEALAVASSVGYPLMVKPSGGGGGIGMAVVADDTELAAVFDGVRSRAQRFFSDPRILLERYVERARHVEVQVLGLGDGRIVALGDRDCSVQRRHQKIVEESPSPGIDDALRTAMQAAAVRAADAVGYRNAGTVEFLVDPRTREFVFLEMNTRLQVEHPVTEEAYGVDLVEAQLQIAAGDVAGIGAREPRRLRHAMELRVCAEDPVRFLPAPGRIMRWREPDGPGVRVDAGYAAGNVVPHVYDPLLAKLVVSGTDRAEVLARARAAVAQFEIDGIVTNLGFLAEVLDHPDFVGGGYDTSIVDRMRR